MIEDAMDRIKTVEDDIITVNKHFGKQRSFNVMQDLKRNHNLIYQIVNNDIGWKVYFDKQRQDSKNKV